MKKTVNFAVYPRSTHALSEPKLQLDALQRNFDWFVEHVKNKDLCCEEDFHMGAVTDSLP